MSRVLKLVLAITVCLQAGAARSQAPAPATAPVPAAPPGPDTGPPGSDVDIRVRQRSTLSPDDMVKQAQEYRARLDDTVQRLQAAVDDARRQKDVIRLNCILDKLAQLKATVPVADSGLQSLREAVARKDDGASVHEYTRLTIMNQKALVLASDAQGCVGEDLGYVGATKVDVDVSGVPPGDFTDPSTPRPGEGIIGGGVPTAGGVDTGGRPPVASPYK
jgi:hypothetical protein